MKRILYAVILTLAAIPVFADEKSASGPVWMTVVHEVEDHDAWRTVFDSGLSTRQSAGELQFEISRHPEYPNRIIATFRWDTAERARAFVDDPFVRHAMMAAGVLTDPIVTFHDARLRHDGP